jgi:hypothetical protein
MLSVVEALLPVPPQFLVAVRSHLFRLLCHQIVAWLISVQQCFKTLIIFSTLQVLLLALQLEARYDSMRPHWN